MKHRRSIRPILAAVALLATTLVFLLMMAPTEAAPAVEEAAVAEWDVVADGLANPRGLVFGPDGALYVAEAGAGGEGACVLRFQWVTVLECNETEIFATYE